MSRAAGQKNGRFDRERKLFRQDRQDFDLNAPAGVGVAKRDYSRVLEFDPTTLEIVWQYTPREAARGAVNTPYFYSRIISGMQRLPNGNTLITEGDDGRVFEVTRDHEVVWEYVSPHRTVWAGGMMTWIYRAYRVPYEWVPQVEKPAVRAIPRIDNSRFKVPGSPRKRAGKVTRVKSSS